MARKTKQNNITSAEKTALINPFNMQLKRDFLDYLKSVQRSPKTIEGYDNDLLIVFTYILDRLDNKKFTELTKREVVGLQNWMINENGNSPARVRRIKAAISSMSNYISNVLDDEPEFQNYRPIVRQIENPALQPVREKTVWDDAELEALLDKLTNEKKDYQKACLLALAMYSGRRKSELCRFKVSDFAEDKLVCDGALYKSAPIKTKGRGGGKFIPCYTLAKRFQPYLDLWLNCRTENGIESEWLFPASDSKEHISPTLLNSWAKTFSRMTGRDFYFHSLRHAFTTYLVRAGIPDSVIAQIVSWESNDMVKVYTDIDADEQIGMYFSGGDICAPQRKSLDEL